MDEIETAADGRRAVDCRGSSCKYDLNFIKAAGRTDFKTYGDILGNEGRTHYSPVVLREFLTKTSQGELFLAESGPVNGTIHTTNRNLSKY